MSEGPEWDVPVEEIPDFVAARDHAIDELVRFVRALRRAGVNVPANAGTTAGRALAAVGFERERAKVAVQACLVTEHKDETTYERLFPEFWRRLTAGFDTADPTAQPENGPEGGFSPLGEEATPGKRASDDGTDTGEDESDQDGTDNCENRTRVVGRESESDNETESVTTARYSPTGRRTGISAPGVDAEFEEAFEDLTRSLATRSGRRWRSGGDERVDVRRALRASVETGGTIVDVPRRQRKRNAVRGCLLVDVSRSVLDVADRSFLLEFCRRAREAWREARIFFFDDDFREVTSSFDARTGERALDALARAETEWGGGTKIGESFAACRERAPEAVSRRSVVLVVSDGLEMGDVSTLEREAAWLSRRAQAVFWLNPLAASSEYEPTARGMAAAVPYLDGLFAFADPTDLAEMARQLHRQGPHGRIGYEYDPRRSDAADGRREKI